MGDWQNVAARHRPAEREQQMVADVQTPEKLDVRAMAVDGANAFARVGYEDLQKAGTPFYITNIEHKETERGALVGMDAYDIDGELIGKIHIARRAVLDQIHNLEINYPDSKVFGPFKFTRDKNDGTQSKTYMLTPYKAPAK